MVEEVTHVDAEKQRGEKKWACEDTRAGAGCPSPTGSQRSGTGSTFMSGVNTVFLFQIQLPDESCLLVPHPDLALTNSALTLQETINFLTES